MDWINALKLLSTIGAGLSGAMALLTEFKDKATGKMTPWGRISLAGILLATTVGLITQWMEHRSDEAKSQKDATSTDYMVHALASMSLPMSGASWRMNFIVPCDQSQTRKICEDGDTVKAISEFIGQDSVFFDISLSELNSEKAGQKALQMGGSIPATNAIAFLRNDAGAMRLTFETPADNRAELALASMTDLASTTARFWIMPEKLRPYFADAELVNPKGLEVVASARQMTKDELGTFIHHFPERPGLTVAITTERLRDHAKHSIDELPSD